MRVLFRPALAMVLVWAIGRGVAAQPPEGSQLSPDENACAMCHGEEGIWEEDALHLYMPAEQFADDVHWQKGVNCHDCHGGDPEVFDPGELHAREDGFRELKEVWNACGNCHEEQRIDLVQGVHAKAGQRDERGQAAPLGCAACHGENSHLILPVEDPKSPVFLDHQVETCGGCHEAMTHTYRISVHGHGLYVSGLLSTAVCADCHKAHGAYKASDPRSALHVANVADTCGRCHRFIEERLQESVHGQGRGPGRIGEETARGGTTKRKPSCTDCHQGHDYPHPEETPFRLALPHRCGNCHLDLSREYSLSIHGELTELGYGPAAKCSDCHGAHLIFAASDPRSRLAPQNRRETCRTCHRDIYAASGFFNFDPHANHYNAARDPLLFWTYLALLSLIVLVFGVFGLHSLLWFSRSLVDVVQHGRPKGLVAGAAAYPRFGRFHRISHTITLVSFLGLALTGLPLKYCHSGWGKALASLLGGFESTSVWHRIFGITLFGCFIACLVRMARHYRASRRQGASRRSALFGPDSLLPNLRDLKDFGRMVGWFVGLRPKPKFERWSYWEKFDFWGACADTVIIGSTGLILWFPGFFCIFLPGKMVNVAKVIHSTQALLATGFVFAIHFFSTHLRPEKFPADLSVFTGLVGEGELKEERPELYERLRREGGLEQLRLSAPSNKTLWLYRLSGFLALGVGLSVLAGMILASLARS